MSQTDHDHAHDFVFDKVTAAMEKASRRVDLQCACQFWVLVTMLADNLAHVIEDHDDGEAEAMDAIIQLKDRLVEAVAATSTGEAIRILGGIVDDVVVTH